jgi:hypothetical protein
VNGRRFREQTPVGRLASVAVAAREKCWREHRSPPDYADFRTMLEPFIKKELLLAKLEEARKRPAGPEGREARCQQLLRELVDVEAECRRQPE